MRDKIVIGAIGTALQRCKAACYDYNAACGGGRIIDPRYMVRLRQSRF